MIEHRFAEEQRKVQGFLNEIGSFKNEANEDNKVFIDRFRKLVDDVRSIDETQVPTDLSLMGVLKTAMLSDKGELTFQPKYNDPKPHEGYYFQVESKRDEDV